MSMVPSDNRSSALVPSITKPRLPYHPALQERFGVDINEWRALVDAVFPSAKEPSSVILALSYCRARKLDPFKKPVHIVPVWNSDLGRMVETVWPGIGELRTTAFRTGQYAGRDPADYGPTLTQKVGKIEVTFPEWCQVTVYRLLNGQRMPFPGPRVYWLESYAVTKRDDPSPNSMWRRRPNGQIDKCAEAAALRGAFPEEIGNEMTSDEMEGKSIGSGQHDLIEAKHGTIDNPLSDDEPASKPGIEHDHETGEIGLAAMGEDAAGRGTEVLEKFLGTLSDADRKTLGAERIAAWRRTAEGIDALESGDPDLAGAVS